LFCELVDGLAEFLNLAAESFDVPLCLRRTALFTAGSLAARFFTAGLLATTFVPARGLAAFTAQVGAEAVGDLVEVLGGLGETGFTQVTDGLFHVAEFLFQFRAGGAVGPAVAFSPGFAIPARFAAFATCVRA